MEVYFVGGLLAGWFGFWALQTITGAMKKTGPVFAAHVLPVKKSDIIVITAPGEIPVDTAIRLKTFFAEAHPGTRALVLGSGMTLTVVQKYGEE